MRRGAIFAMTLSMFFGFFVLLSTPAVASPEAASVLVAQSGKPRRLTTKTTIPPAAAEPAAGGAATVDPNALRTILDMPELAWKDLSRTEATALAKLDWSKRSWDGRTAPTAQWPQSMRTKYLNLTAVQKASVRKLGYRPLEWDLRVRNRVLRSE